MANLMLNRLVARTGQRCQHPFPALMLCSTGIQQRRQTTDYPVRSTPQLLQQTDPLREDDHYHPLQKDPLWESVAPIMPPSFNLASFVNKSELLQQMVKLGVSLYEWDKIKDVNSWVIKMNFESDVKPVIQFLVDSGVSPDTLGNIFTNSPHILRERLEDLEVRKNYLEAKKFNPEMIGRIFSRNPTWLLHSTQEIDKKLGLIQQIFELSGNEVRSLTAKEPRLITCQLHKIKVMNFGLMEEMGFDAPQMKSLLLTKPKLWLMNKSILVERFDYLHNIIKMSHETILKFPAVLTCRDFRMKQRHEFLRHLNRDQYDPNLSNYVSPIALIKDTDAHFAVHVAKSSITLFNQFCKTM
nr:EOG090X0C5Y [Eubosmina coregoni]